MMKKLLPFILAIAIWLVVVLTAKADSILVDCKDSAAFQERVASYPDNYYFNE